MTKKEAFHTSIDNVNSIYQKGYWKKYLVGATKILLGQLSNFFNTWATKSKAKFLVTWILTKLFNWTNQII